MPGRQRSRSRTEQGNRRRPARAGGRPHPAAVGLGAPAVTSIRPTGLAVPHLFGVPGVIGSGEGRAQRAAIALALLDAGVASPALWRASYTSPDVFLKKALNNWVWDRSDESARERFPVTVRLDFDVDPWSALHPMGAHCDRGIMQHGDPVYLVVESEFAAFFPLGATFAWLERFDSQLPATVYQKVSAIKRALYVYDWCEAMEHDAMMAENFEEGPELEAYRKDNPAIALPPCLERRPLTAGQIRRGRRTWPAEVRRVLDAAELVLTASSAVNYGTKREREARWKVMAEGDYGRTRPTLVIASDEGDRVCAAFDDEMMGDDGCPPEPLRFWIIERPTAAAVRRAFEGLDQVLRAIAAVTAFFEAVPGKGKVAPETLGAVLEGPAEGCGPVRVRAA